MARDRRHPRRRADRFPASRRGAAPPASRVLRDGGKKPSPRTWSMSSRCTVALIVPPTRPVPLPRMVTGCSSAFEPGASSFSFATPAIVPQCTAAGGCRAAAAAPPVVRRPLWASARSMLSPPSKMCSPTATRSSCRSPACFGDGDQREVGGAAADIDHQHQIAVLFTRSPPVRVALDPCVEGGLRLLEQCHVAVPRGFRGLSRSARARPRRMTPAPLPECPADRRARRHFLIHAARRCSR